MTKQLEKIKELIAKREQARLGGGEKAIEKQHARGKYTAQRLLFPGIPEFKIWSVFRSFCLKVSAITGLAPSVAPHRSFLSENIIPVIYFSPYTP
jgi:hypothetical protein